jgi:hypothetical protein
VLSPLTACTQTVRGRFPDEGWGGFTRRNASLEGVDSSERAAMIEGLTHQRVPPAKGLCTPLGRLSKTWRAELDESSVQETVLVECAGFMEAPPFGQQASGSRLASITACRPPSPNQGPRTFLDRIGDDRSRKLARY